jgi:hypothetical protein
MLTNPAICGRGSYYCIRFEAQARRARSKLNLPMSGKERHGLCNFWKGQATFPEAKWPRKIARRDTRA